ncbi:DegT/DnrJ/EryC1/StrS family aminotransferase [Desulfovibrionales bacterium]
MQLAIFGGEPVRREPFPAYRTIGETEKIAVNRVLDSGVLSKYLGCWHDDFFGGPEVRALEAEWAMYFGCKHVISVNSATSGLIAAIGAAGVEPGDEVIVSPYTMSATAVAILIWNAVPVFADIEPEYFCLDPASVETCITPRTRAILVVSLFGQPYDASAINAIAVRYGLTVIEDASQAPGARLGDKYAGTLGTMGIFSLNYHKHIHCGEGGIVVTDDDRLAERLQLIRNHAEAVVESKGVTDLTNMLGFNFRLPEMESALARCQLIKLAGLVEERQGNVAWLAEQLSAIPALRPGRERPGAEHAWYVHPLRFNAEVASVPRNDFIAAVRAELPVCSGRESDGPLIFCGYVQPLYFQPLYQQRICYGRGGFPFVNPWTNEPRSYFKGMCPITERLHEHELFFHELMRSGMGRRDLEDVVAAFYKVWELRDRLRLV